MTKTSLLSIFLAMTAMGGLGAGASAAAFSTGFEAGQEQFDSLGGVVVNSADGAPVHSGDSAYFIGNDNGNSSSGQYLNFSFGDRAPGTLTFWIYDPAHVSSTYTDSAPTTGYGPRWGVTANAQSSDTVVGGSITYRSFGYNADDQYSYGNGQGNNPASTGSWFSIIGEDPPRIKNAWALWTIENVTTGDPGVFHVSYENEAGTAGNSHDLTVDTVSGLTDGGIGGFYLYGGGKSAPELAGIYVDDITWTPAAVPEPASLALVGLGAVGLLRRKRRESC